MARNDEEVALVAESDRDHEAVRKRLQLLKRERFGGTASDMAGAANLDKSTLGRVLSGETEKVTDKVVSHVLQNISGPSGQTLRENWLEFGEGAVWEDELTEQQETSSSTSPRSDIVKVDHFGPAAAGDGRMLEPKGQVTFTRKEFTVRFGHRSPDQVGLFEVIGDSAVPVYYDGEDVPVEVKGGTQEFKQDTVYVFRYQKKDVMIKRLRRLDDDRIRAQSLNPGIDDQILYHHQHDFAILGRVIDNQKQQLYTSLVNRFLRRNNQQLPALE